jgi:hypothetical protein
MEKNNCSIENPPTAQSNAQRMEHNSIHNSSRPSSKGACIGYAIELSDPGRLKRSELCTPQCPKSFSVLRAESL